MSVERHNHLAPEIVMTLIKSASSEEDCMVMLESVVLGIMLFYRPAPRQAAEFLDLMTMAVVERMKP